MLDSVSFAACSWFLMGAATLPSLPPLTVVSRGVASMEPVAVSESAVNHHNISLVSPKHPSEVMARIPATWISRGSGQEHLTAIRSPVLTGAGACGSFLILEDNVPIRPAGFCNVNNLFELNLLQAQSIRVQRGPGRTLHGSNAQHGVIEVRSPSPWALPDFAASVELGSDEFQRLSVVASGRANHHAFALLANGTSSGSFRELEGFDEQKVNLVVDSDSHDGWVGARFAATNLNQETAGFILGEDSYRDSTLRRQNLNPEAYRDAYAVRASAVYRLNQWTVIPYARRSRMNFLQHFLPGKPLERNGQNSTGVLTSWLTANDDRELTLGIDLEYADTFLDEFQDQPAEGSDFLRETRPVGLHYDYQVDIVSGAVFANGVWQLGNQWWLATGLRLERLRYDYDNRASDGNLREDGTACGFGGCLYNRPSDRSDSFTNLAPKLSLTRRFDDRGGVQFRAARGFRVPQATELYRLQRGQEIADLESETLDSLSIGGWLKGERVLLSVTAFTMRKSNVILRDAEGINVSDGKTRHQGIEAEFEHPLNNQWQLSGALTYADHEYAFDRMLSGGEQIQSGNQVDTAPRTIASARLQWRPHARDTLELEWIHLGGYFMDAANSARYPGHDLLNLRWRHSLAGNWTASLRLSNLLDKRYAERADFAFGNFRYFPGSGRAALIQLSYSP